MTPEHIHWRDLTGLPGDSVIFCHGTGHVHTGKLWRVTCPWCLAKLDDSYDASKAWKR